MSGTITDLDGLPAGEIRLLVEQSERKTVELLEAKFTEHRELIEARLDKQDSKLASMGQDLCLLVGSGPIPGLVIQIKDSLDQYGERQTTMMEVQAAGTMRTSNIAAMPSPSASN